MSNNMYDTYDDCKFSYYTPFLEYATSGKLTNKSDDYSYDVVQLELITTPSKLYFFASKLIFLRFKVCYYL